jgi:hypothetical protein
MNNLTTQKNVKIVKNCVLLGAICLFCVWIGFSLCACVTANVLNDAMDNAGDDVNAATTSSGDYGNSPATQAKSPSTPPNYGNSPATQAKSPSLTTAQTVVE